MMDPIYPWLDPIEVRRLADGLMRRHGESVTPYSDAGFNEAFIGFANQPANSAPADVAPVVAVPVMVPRPPEAPVVSAVPAPEELRSELPDPVVSENDEVVGRGPFLDRVGRFRDWMRAQFGATGIFILDREGAVIFDESKHGRLHFLARSLALASRRQRNSTGNVHVKISAGSTLEVIPVETAYGCLVLGALVPEALSPAAVASVMEALSAITTPPRS